ncbi:MAG TPA: hypothetical protein VM008_07085 [Phycisphaerae bacterium]|nr:hypothetical protein [Phycisphaerae bacterium]
MKRIFAAILLAVVTPARADILVLSNNTFTDGKILSQSPTEILLQPADNSPPQHLPRSQISRILLTDDHGALLPNPSQPTQQRPIAAPPPEPTAPPLAILNTTGPTYYLIPLHGEVGATILASALDKSLADAALRNRGGATVVVLDINSPGGLVEEAEKILKVLHHYNAKLRIVALTDQDLSAAAIITLSVKEIYVKPSSTIGAAVSFIPNKLFLPPKLEEKFQSAWRAVARNSAEEGGHEPLLADAMIDPSFDLRIISVDGKPTVVEGPPLPGKSPLLRKGKILTLTSHEAIDCGLAAGEAEDLDDLAKQLHLSPWTECKGLAVPLADCITRRATSFKTEIDKINADLADNLIKAQQSDPSQSIRVNISRPGQPAASKPAEAHNPIADRLLWKQRSLATVIFLQNAEQNVRDAIALSNAFGQETTADALQRLLAKIAEGRAGIFDNRNRFGEGAAAVPTAPTPATASSNANNLPRPNLPAQITTLSDAQLALTSPEYDDQARAAKFLATAPVDPAQQKKITNLLLPLFQGPDTNRQYIFMEAFAHWAAREDASVLLAILSSPARSAANPNPQNRYWPPAITALVRLDPAAAEPILQQRKSEFYFRSKITFALQSLIDANSPDKPAAQHLLEILRPNPAP